MDSRYLRAFVTVAEVGGISAAAQKLGYAQSSLSAQLRRFEVELGVPVVTRMSTGAPLTDAGRRLLPYARQALELDDRMRRAAAESRPRLRIGALETLAAEWLPDILAALGNGAGGPDADAEVSMAVGSRAALNEDMEAGRLDLLFLFENGSTAAGPATVVGYEPVDLVVGPSHPLADADRVTEEDLREAEFLIAEIGCTSHLLLDRFGRDLLPQIEVGMVTGSFGALRRLAAHGRGIALLPRLTVAREMDDGELVPLDLVREVRPAAIEARWRSGLGAAEPTLQAVLRLARRHTDQLGPEQLPEPGPGTGPEPEPGAPTATVPGA